MRQKPVYIYAPLAHRLGLYNIRTEFSDICLKITEPEAYGDIASNLKNTEKERKKYIKDIITPLKEKFDLLALPYRIVGRPKSIASVYNKIKTKRVTFDEIYDLFAIRVIIDAEGANEKAACLAVLQHHYRCISPYSRAIKGLGHYTQVQWIRILAHYRDRTRW